MGKILVNTHLYSFIGRPIEAYFKSLKKDKAEIVSKIRDEIINHIRDFIPCNKRIWDILFKDWQKDLDNIILDLVVGCKEPNDAFVLKDLNERHHMIFDLLCWEKYVGKISLSKLSQNLLTHELFHGLIGSIIQILKKVNNLEII